MSLDKFKELMSIYRNAGVTTYSELILGLPCETYESFCKGIGMLLEAGQHERINTYNCIILPNSPMGAKDYLEKYGIKTAEVPLFTTHRVETEIVEKTKYVIGSDTMTTEEWIASNIFACFVRSFHNYGILQKLAIYFHYEKNIAYEDFYNSVINWYRSSDNEIIKSSYKYLYNFYERFSLAQPMELYCNEEVYGKITWSPEYAPHMDTVYWLDGFYNEIRPLLTSFETDEAILNELIEYQNCVMKRPEHNNFSRDFTYGWHEYFEKIIAGEYAPLKKYSNRLNVNNKKTLVSWQDYALKDVWFGKDGGTFNPGITNDLL